MLAAKTIVEAVFRHVVPVASAAAEPVRKIIRGAAARDLPSVPIRPPAGHYSGTFSIGLMVSSSNLARPWPPPRWPESR